MDILAKITKGKAGISRANAQNYTNKVLEAISIIKSFQDIVNKGHSVRKQRSDDTIIKTSSLELSGEIVVLNMAFCSENKEPYSAEILKEIEE